MGLLFEITPKNKRTESHTTESRPLVYYKSEGMHGSTTWLVMKICILYVCWTQHFPWL